MSNETTVILRAPAGTDEANYGTERFSVRDDGTIEVPAEIASTFETGAAGFVEVNPHPHFAPPTGTVRVKGPGASLSWGGTSYSVDASGLVTIPAAALPDVRSHGFCVA